MFKAKYRLVFVLAIAAVFYLVSFLMNDWFSETMPRHQLLQLPVMILLGIVTSVYVVRFTVHDISWGIALLILVMASLVFWMLPRSVDSAVISPLFNRVMHLNMFLTGLVLVPVLSGTIFEIRIVFLGMTAVMLMATGFALQTFDILLCSSFTILQQNETGFYLILAGSVLFVTTIFVFFRELQNKANPG